jgi:hypothetical protein
MSVTGRVITSSHTFHPSPRPSPRTYPTGPRGRAGVLAERATAPGTHSRAGWFHKWPVLRHGDQWRFRWAWLRGRIVGSGAVTKRCHLVASR